MKLVLGLDFKDRNGRWVQSFKIQGVQVYTWCGRKYKSMKDRAKLGGAEQRRYPRYKGCTTTFKDFQDFADWATAQKGYLEENFELDKDLLSESKIYCKETSIFVPKEINLLLNKVSPLRSKHGIGVKQLRSGRFSSKLKYNNKNVNLGTFDTKEEAFLAYKIAKEAKIKFLANEYKSLIDTRCYNLLMNYEVNEYD